MIYLDHAASTPVRREVLEAMWPYLVGEFGNPSSHHEVGASAAHALARSRQAIAAHLDCRPAELILTSGGTESDNLAVKGIVLASTRGRHVITSAIEHEAVLESVDFLRRFHDAAVTILPVDADGLVSVTALSEALRPDTALVSIQHANNEVGVVQDIASLVAVARAAGVPFHTDAVQSAGWLPFPVDADAITIAGHKLGAPKGIGLLKLRAGIPLEPLLHGGGQERGRRSGTENVAGLVGLATALQLAPRDHSAEVRDALIDGVLGSVPGAFLTGSRTHRLANHASFCFPGTSGEAVLLELERHGITCSSGSACAAGSDEPSHVLTAMGIPASIAQTAVRFTLAESTTLEEVDEVVGRVRDAVAAVLSLGG